MDDASHGGTRTNRTSGPCGPRSRTSTPGGFGRRLRSGSATPSESGLRGPRSRAPVYARRPKVRGGPRRRWGPRSSGRPTRPSYFPYRWKLNDGAKASCQTTCRTRLSHHQPEGRQDVGRSTVRPFVGHSRYALEPAPATESLSRALGDHPQTEQSDFETPPPPDSEQFRYETTVKYGGQGSGRAADNRPTNGLSSATYPVGRGTLEGSGCT